MVLSTRPRAALIVPDELSWTVWGTDPAERGLTPASAPEYARGLLVPEVVPAALAGPLVAALARVPQRPLVIADSGPNVTGSHVAELLGRSAQGGGDHHDSQHDHGDHGEHGHDMMAIVGDPSADGLVMEPVELELGPLSSSLPGGLIASLRLDGDLVVSCELRSTLVTGNGRGAVDPLAPVAWAVAAIVATELADGTHPAPATAWRRIAAVELERAVSHLAWLRSVGRLLGWDQLVACAQRTLQPLLEARRDAGLAATPRGPGAGADARDLAVAAKRAGKLTGLLEGSRLAARARGRGRLASGTAPAGPNGRAAGALRDARDDDPFYRALGFEPVGGHEGDVEARVLVRAREAVASVALVTDALARAAAGRGWSEGPGFASPAGAAVEGPRGPVLASSPGAGAAPLVVAPGAAATAAAAAAAATDQEWSAALLTLVSFDLSGWQVAG